MKKVKAGELDLKPAYKDILEWYEPEKDGSVSIVSASQIVAGKVELPDGRTGEVQIHIVTDQRDFMTDGE